MSDLNLQHSLEKLTLELVKEHKRTRRWKIFFRLFYLILIVMILSLFLLDSTNLHSSHKKQAAIIKMRGVLEADGAIDADMMNKSLKAAFHDPSVDVIVLQIDSPGGSPVQANEIYDYMHYLEKKYPQKKTYALCTDVCASGAYYVAAAADKIYANQASLVGSIGVLMDGFGFVDSLQKLGIQRRLMTAGKEKGFLDPFSPVKPQDAAYMQKMLDIIHQQFIEAVKAGRGKRLKNDPIIFSGLVFTGTQALPLGLVDDLATPESFIHTVLKDEPTVDYTQSPSIMDRFARTIGITASTRFASTLGLQGAKLK